MAKGVIAIAVAAGTVIACGARSGVSPGEGAGREAPPRTGVEDAGPASDPRHDAAADVVSPADSEPEDDSGPTCADVGKLPGFSTCCNGKYCAGECVAGGPGQPPLCKCSSIHGGCIWPLSCCAGTCKGGVLCGR
jgi:hypothetical protein